MPMIELTTAEKWREVDAIIERVESRKRRGERPYYTYLDEYVDLNFNKGKGNKDNG